MNQADTVSAATVISLNFRSRDPVDEKTTGVITVVIQQPESALNHFVVNKTSDGFLVCWTVVVYVHARIDEAVKLQIELRHNIAAWVVDEILVQKFLQPSPGLRYGRQSPTFRKIALLLESLCFVQGKELLAGVQDSGLVGVAIFVYASQNNLLV